MKSLTLGIPVYNSEKFLPQLFSSLKRQKQLPNEIIIVDDESNDASWSLIEKFDIKRSDVTIRKIRNASNVGIAATYNIILKNSSSEWIQILDSDDYLINDDYYVFVDKLPDANLAVIVTGIKTNSRFFNFLNLLIVSFIPGYIPHWLPLLGFITVRSAVIYRKAVMTEFSKPVFDGSDIIHLDKVRKKGKLFFAKSAKLFYRIHGEANTRKLTSQSYVVFLKTLHGKKKFFFLIDFIFRKKIFSFLRRRH